MRSFETIYVKHQEWVVGRGVRCVSRCRFFNLLVQYSTQRARRSGPVLSQQVKALIGEGNQAFVDGDLNEAIRVMQEVIRIEPRAPSAWNVLARCYESLGDNQKALQLRIMGAHLNQDPEEWEALVQRSK